MSTLSASDLLRLARGRAAGLAILAAAGLLAAAAIVPAAAEKRVVRRVDVGQGGDVSIETDASDSSGASITFSGKHGLVVVDDQGGDMVRVFDDAYVGPADHVEGDVVAVFGSVEVEGKVDGNVVAVMGSVRLGPRAEVGQDLVSVGGSLDRDEDSVVRGQTVSVGFLPVFGMPGLPLMIACVALGWIVAILTGWLFSTLFPTRFMRVAATASRRTGASFLVGLLSMPLAMVAMVLLFVTVIGIPIAVLLPLLHGVIAFAGQLAAVYLLGLRLTGRRFGTAPMLPMVVGTTLVAAFYVVSAMLFTIPGITRPAGLFFALLGTLLVCALTAIGCGAFLLSRLGSRPRDVIWAGADPFPAPPAPPAGQATGAAAGTPAPPGLSTP